jgi:hypothetical protein
MAARGDVSDLDFEEPSDIDDFDGNDGCAGGDAEPASPGKGAPKHKGGKPKAKSKVKVDKFDKKKRGKIVDGKKWCKGCLKWLALEAFPPGSAHCAEDRKVLQNLRNAAKSQGKMEWYEKITTSTEEALCKVIQAYKNRVKAKEGKVRAAGPFPILQYIDEVAQETSIILDGVYEMMHQQHYVAFAGKAKNGSIDPQEAALRWAKLYDAPDSMTDRTIKPAISCHV